MIGQNINYSDALHTGSLLDGAGESGILGKKIRVVLPSCAVMCIRNFYPPPGQEEQFAFEGFHIWNNLI